MPLRANILWEVPASLLATYICILAFAGSRFPDPLSRILPIVTFVCLMQLLVARRHEMHVSEKWLAVRRMQEQDMELENAASLTRALSSMAGTWSDIIVMLSSELTIVNTRESLEAYFGKPVAGGTMSSMLALGDRKRFDALVLEAARIRVMQSMPASVELEFATLQVQLVLVDTGGRTPNFIVGLRTLGQTPLQDSCQCRPQVQSVSDIAGMTGVGVNIRSGGVGDVGREAWCSGSGGGGRMGVVVVAESHRVTRGALRRHELCRHAGAGMCMCVCVHVRGGGSP